MNAKSPKTAKLFNNGNSQAVRLPKSFRFSGKEVVIQHWGKGALILPADDPWAPLWKSLEQFSPGLDLKREQPVMQTRQGFLP